MGKNPNGSATKPKKVPAGKLTDLPDEHPHLPAGGYLYGIVISEIANPFFAEIIRGFQAPAWDEHSDVLLMNTEYDENRAELVIQKLIASSVRGVAVFTSSLDDSLISQLAANEIAVVTINPVPPSRLVSTLTIDYKHGLVEAIQHVVTLGHRRAAVIAGPESNRTASVIKNVFVEGLRQKGIAPSSVTHSDYQVGAAASALQSILSGKNPPTVVFCGSDLIAMGAIIALEEVGLAVPDDVSIVGVDDLPLSFLARPALTTIRVPRDALGRTAFSAVQNMLKPKTQGGSGYIVETELVVRKSTGPRPR